MTECQAAIGTWNACSMYPHIFRLADKKDKRMADALVKEGYLKYLGRRVTPPLYIYEITEKGKLLRTFSAV